MDEPQSMEGQGLGPDPYTTLLASLAGCTLATLRMYIDRKGWSIPKINIHLNMARETEPEFVTYIKSEITFGTEIPTEQKERLLTIAQKCPVSKILENKIIVETKG